MGWFTRPKIKLHEDTLKWLRDKKESLAKLSTDDYEAFVRMAKTANALIESQSLFLPETLNSYNTPPTGRCVDCEQYIENDQGHRDDCRVKALQDAVRFFVSDK